MKKRHREKRPRTMIRTMIQVPDYVAIGRNLRKLGINVDIAKAAKLQASTERLIRALNNVQKIAASAAALAKLVPAAEREQRAAVITREVKALADELRRSGEDAPVAQAEQKIAEREGFANGPALNRWLRRNRWPGQK